MNVDVEIYCKNLKSFFVNNPTSRDELLSTVPGVTFEKFMERIVEVANENYETNNDPSLTRKQMLDILNDLYIDYVEENYNLIKYGDTNPKNELQESKVFQKLNGFLIGLN
jgi:hypothetical protein